MPESLSDKILEGLGQTQQLYYRLLLVVGPAGAGKTAALRDVANRIDGSVINLNLELSQRLLDVPERQRPIRIRVFLDEIVGASERNTVLLDNTELLFDPSLKQDPLGLIQGISRNKTVVATWNGTIESGKLVYAKPGHPEYRVYALQDFLFVFSGEGSGEVPTNPDNRRTESSHEI